MNAITPLPELILLWSRSATLLNSMSTTRVKVSTAAISITILSFSEERKIVLNNCVMKIGINLDAYAPFLQSEILPLSPIKNLIFSYKIEYFL